MAVPTLSEVMAKLGSAIAPLHQVHLDAPTIVGLLQLEETTDKATPNGAAGYSTKMRDGIRLPIESVLAPGNVRTIMAQGIAELRLTSELSIPEEATDDDVIVLLSRYMVAHGEAIQSRTITRDVASSGIGDALYERCTTDDLGQALEASYCELRQFVCTNDQNNGATRSKEVFEIQGAPFEGQIERGLTNRGSGLILPITSTDAVDSLLENPSFTNVTGTASDPVSLNGWTMSQNTGDGTDWVLDQTNYYLTDQNDGGVPAALLYKAHPTGTTTDIYQSVQDITGFDDLHPYYSGYAVCADASTCGSWKGEILVYLGSQSISYPLCGAVPTIADGSAGLCTAGFHIGAVSFVNAAGVEGPLMAYTSVTLGGAHHASWSAIPTGPTGTADRYLYWSKAGAPAAIGQGPTPAQMYRVHAMGDNTTTVYDLNVADSGLGTTHPWRTARSSVANPTAHFAILNALGPSGNQKYLWSRNWSQDAALVGFQIKKMSGTGVLVDQAITCPYQQHDKNAPAPGQWGLRLSGPTPAKIGDSFTLTDIAAATGIFQEHFWLAYGRSLPHGTGSAVTFPEPSLTP